MEPEVSQTRSRSRSPKAQSQLRSFVFTLNNYTEEDYANVKLHLGALAKYLVIGKEVGTSGTPHLQGYCQLQKRTAFKKIGGMFKWHIEATMGTPDEAADYCKKDGNFEEIGKLSTAAKGGAMEKERWLAVSELAIKGDLEPIRLEYPDIWLRNYRALRNVVKDYAPRVPDAGTECGIWLYGAAGCGKSRSAREWCIQMGYQYYSKNCNKWWDNYQNEPVALMDDVDKTHACLGHHLKIWCDRYAFQAEVKGSAMWIRPHTFIVTSQYTIEDIWEDNETRDALRRRFAVHHIVTYDPANLKFK